MAEVLLIKHVRLDGKVTDVLIRGNRFERIAPELSDPEAQLVDGRGKAIVPPFYNTHTHTPMTLLRGYADDLELFPWLFDHIFPAEAKLTPEDNYAGAKLAALEMIKSGTVFFNDMYFLPEGAWYAADELGLRAVIGMFYHTTEAGELVAQCARDREVMLKLKNASHNPRLALSCAPHAVYSVTDPALQLAEKHAKELGVTYHIHASETRKEVEDCLKRTGKTPIAHLDEIGVLTEHAVLAHCVWATADDLKLIADRGATIAHSPVSNLKLCSGIFPFEDALAAGCRVTLGTDGCASNNNLSMLEEMKIAALAAKCRSGNPVHGSAGAVYHAATAAGAEAFGIDAGVIAEGKLADALLIDLDAPMLVGDYNLVSNLVYAADPSAIDTVICDGRILMSHRQVPGEAAIVEAARKVCDKFRK